ncbi:hypothetical protein [Wenjunlia tyrosinilytica]|uniref:Uncharacterized protein n=1 Tax=Wenjunlia tyrosinilytica TaxID=1544741 RepID=A0A917ZLE3_9ACTN|nr:hypothetical protein [Wenjunlia tyrosinilytica]GGO85718.1 hypothetical protein GCM10012280_20150 [Wenjunlia tyrosinilytica]
MAALAWLIIPVVATLLAAAWGAWAARNRSTGDARSLAGFDRFREVMSESSSDPV